MARDYTKVAETFPDPPRAAKVSPDGWFYGFASLIFVIPVAAFFAVAIPNIQEDLRLEHSPPVRATVVDADSGFNKDKTRWSQLEVRFPVDRYQDTEDILVARDIYDRYPIGSHPLVTYVHENPAIFRLGAMTHARALRDIVVNQVSPSLGFAVLILWIPFLMVYSVRLSLRLLRFGRTATAIVDRVKVDSKGRQMVYYTFEVDGVRWTGYCLYRSSWNTEPHPGGSVRILYLPGKPKRNMPIASMRLVRLCGRQ